MNVTICLTSSFGNVVIWKILEKYYKEIIIYSLVSYHLSIYSHLNNFLVLDSLAPLP